MSGRTAVEFGVPGLKRLQGAGARALRSVLILSGHRVSGQDIFQLSLHGLTAVSRKLRFPGFPAAEETKAYAGH